MDNKVDYQFLYDGLVALQDRIDSLEANQTQSESSTTRCSAAGGGPNESKPARSAGWQAILTEALEYAKERRDHLSRFHHDKRCIGQRVEAQNFIYWIEGRIAEERRRSEERTEPPAG